MNHSELTKESPGSRTAVLFLHGILGTPHHFDGFFPLVPEDWSVYTLLLEGHGKTVDDFAAASMEKWKAQVAAKLRLLSGRYENIILAAHSMGTLFAINAAVTCANVKALFLLAVPLKVFVRPVVIKNAWHVLWDTVPPTDAAALAAKDAYSITPDKHLWKYLRWLPNYLALFAEIRRTRPKIKLVSIPCHIFQSKNDELAARSSMRYWQSNRMITTAILEHSGHFYYEEGDRRFLLEQFRRFCADLPF